MNSKKIIRLIIGVFAILFLWIQISSIAHATTYPDQDHDHDGTVCVLATLAVKPACLPVATFDYVVQISSAEPVRFIRILTILMPTPPGRAPPPRSPPYIF